MSHSKRNTSLAFFTSHERDELKGHWGSKSTRLTRESFLPFGSCRLCLLPARSPVACPTHGHLFCRECAVSNLLAQNQERKRLEKEAEQRRLDDAEEKELNDAEAQASTLEEFERAQTGLGGGGRKRKLEIEDEVLRLAREGMSKRRATSDKSQLPSFWVPSEIPESQKRDLKVTKQNPLCPAATADAPHEISLKTLLAVHFTQDDAADSPARMCPSCNKTLSNTTKALLAKPCGHVLCKPCGEKFLKAPEKSAHDESHDDTVRCYVCQEDVTPGRRVKRKQGAEDGGHKEKKDSKAERGIVELSTEGTGFAGGGRNMVRKEGVAFQC